MLAIFHSQFWDGEGEAPPPEPGEGGGTFSSWQVAVIASLLLFIVRI